MNARVCSMYVKRDFLSMVLSGTHLACLPAPLLVGERQQGMEMLALALGCYQVWLAAASCGLWLGWDTAGPAWLKQHPWGPPARSQGNP